MKHKYCLLLAALLFCNAGYSQTQQTAPAFADNTSFFASVQSYFTSFNTNLDSTFGVDKGSAWAGVASVQNAGVPLQNEIGISYALYKQNLAAEVILRDSGVAGTIVSVGGGFSYSKIIHDTRLTAFVDGGYYTTPDTGKDKAFGEVGVRVSKALTTHTFAGISAALQFPHNRRVFEAFTGFTF